MAATFKVLYDFQAEEEGELGVYAGDFVNAFAGDDGVFGTEDDTRDGWVLVEMTHAPYSTGYVPTDYLERVSTQARDAAAIAGATAPEQDIGGLAAAPRKNTGGAMAALLSTVPKQEAPVTSVQDRQAMLQVWQQQISSEGGWREKLALIKERTREIDASRERSEDTASHRRGALLQGARQAVESARQDRESSGLSGRHVLEQLNADIARLERRRNEHETRWTGEFKVANDLLREHLAAVASGAYDEPSSSSPAPQQAEQENAMPAMPAMAAVTVPVDAMPAPSYAMPAPAAVEEGGSGGGGGDDGGDSGSSGGGGGGVVCNSVPELQKLLSEGVIDHREFKELRKTLKAEGSVTVGCEGSGAEEAPMPAPMPAEPVDMFPAPAEEEQDEIPAPAPMPAAVGADAAAEAEHERSSSVSDVGARRASILAPAAPDGRSEGWLFKKGQGKSAFGRRNWKRRWCQLVQYQDDQQWYLEYYESEKDVPKQKYKGTVCISGAEVSRVTNEKTPDKFFFDIVRSGPEGDLKHPFEILSMYTEDPSEGQAWLNTMQGVAALAVPQPASARNERATSAPADPLLHELD